MWTSGRGSRSSSGGGSDPERERRVHSDGARKRGVRSWTNRGLSPPPSFLVRETKEYDRRHGRTPSLAAGSSSAARSSRAASSSSSGARLLTMKREWSEEPEEIEVVVVKQEPEEIEVVVVKQEPEEIEVVVAKQEPEEIERRGVVRPEDFMTDFDAVAAAIAERSLREEAERRRHDDKVDDLIVQQAVVANLVAKEKDDEWRRIREEKRSKSIDLVSSDEE